MFFFLCLSLLWRMSSFVRIFSLNKKKIRKKEVSHTHCLCCCFWFFIQYRPMYVVVVILSCSFSGSCWLKTLNSLLLKNENYIFHNTIFIFSTLVSKCTLTHTRVTFKANVPKNIWFIFYTCILVHIFSWKTLFFIYFISLLFRFTYIFFVGY